MKVEAKTFLKQIEDATRIVKVDDLPVRDRLQKLSTEIKVVDFSIAEQVAKDIETGKVELIVSGKAEQPLTAEKDEILKYLKNHKQQAQNKTLNPIVETEKKKAVIDIIDFKVFEELVGNIESGRWIFN